MVGLRTLLVTLAATLVSVGGAQSFLPPVTFGESCEVVLERVLVREGVRLFDGSGCGAVGLPELWVDGEFSGFKASIFDRAAGLSVYILYYYFEDDRLVAVMVGSSMGFEALNAIAETSYGPYEKCFDIEDSGLLGVACIGFTEDAAVRWVRTDVHASLTFVDSGRFGELGRVPPEASFEAAEAVEAVEAVDGFQLVSFDTRREGDIVWALGEVRNVGGGAAGVELQVIARDASGRLVDVVTFWPASTQNIRPGTSYGFRYPVTRERSAVRFEIQVVGTEAW